MRRVRWLVSTFGELKQAAIELFLTQMPFLLTRRTPEVVLIVATGRARRFALVTPEEASLYVERLGAPGEALRELRRDPDGVNIGAPGCFWVVAMIGHEAVYFAFHLKAVSARAADLN